MPTPPGRMEQIRFSQLERLWQSAGNGLSWDCLFVSPPWLDAWWQVFGKGKQARIFSVSTDGKIIGVAPLMVKDNGLAIIGDPEICDYLDFIVAPAAAEIFYRSLIPMLRRNAIRRLDLRSVRPDSTILTVLPALAPELGCTVTITPEALSYGLSLPESWDEYLQSLKGKHRHEIRRKLRRLDETGPVGFRLVAPKDALAPDLKVFFELFRTSRSDKDGFMNQRMTRFFQTLTERLGNAGILRLGFLDIDQKPAAVVMTFDYNDTVYLYNNGYDPRYRKLSVGMLCKVLSIRNSIEQGRTTYDFLKGQERYKQQMGGQPLQLCRCVVTV